MCLICVCFISPKVQNSILTLLCSLLPVTEYISDKYRGRRRRERINTKHTEWEVKKKKKTLSESLTAWSTQVADSQETDLIMLLVTMLCPYSGWHRCWQRPPLHSNQETKCRGAPQSPVGGSLANHLPASRGKPAESTAPDIQYRAIRQTELASHPGDQGPPRGEGRREADQLIDR